MRESYTPMQGRRYKKPSPTPQNRRNSRVCQSETRSQHRRDGQRYRNAPSHRYNYENPSDRELAYERQSRQIAARNRKKVQKKRRHKRKHPIRRFVCLLVLFVILAASLLLLYAISALSEIENHPLQDVTIAGQTDPNLGNFQNIALFGVDSRANDLKENTRSDSIMIASINKKTNEVQLLSVYRDTYAQIREHGCTKINHAYAYGGPDLAVDTLNTNFDLNIEDFVTVNFSALSNVIDELGGITLDIQDEELKWVNAYGRDVAKINGQSYTKLTHSGTQTVTGAQATGYCRVRYTSGGDFTRAKRQRTVLQAIFSKAKTASPTKWAGIVNKMTPQIYTSLSTTDMLALLLRLPLYEMGEQTGFPYKQNGHKGTDGIYYGFPDTLSSNVVQLHETLFGTKDYVPSDTVNKISKKTSG